MFYLYYNNFDKIIEITPEKRAGRGLDLLETNQLLESLIVRSDMYAKTYKCEVVNSCEDKVNKMMINKITNKNVKRKPVSEETRRKISAAVTGKRNGRYGVKDPEHIRRSKSIKLKQHYKYNVHGKKGYVDSEETRRLKSINNNNKGGWFWIHNHQIQEERRCYGEIPEGFRKGRLYNYFD